MAREAAEAAGREVGLLGDLPGPKLRVGDIHGDVLHLLNGQEINLTTDATATGRDVIPVAWQGLPAAVKAGDAIYLADGSIRLRVQRAPARRGPHAGRDRRHRRLAPGHEPAGREALSVRGGRGRPRVARLRRRSGRRADGRVVRAQRQRPRSVKARLAERGADIPIIAKIEKHEAAEAAEEIVRRATAASWSRAATSASSCRSRRSRTSKSGCCRSPGATRSRRSRRRRCSRRWSARPARPAPRRPTSRTRSSTAPTR